MRSIDFVLNKGGYVIDIDGIHYQYGSLTVVESTSVNSYAEISNSNLINFYPLTSEDILINIPVFSVSQTGTSAYESPSCTATSTIASVSTVSNGCQIELSANPSAEAGTFGVLIEGNLYEFTIWHPSAIR